MSKKSYNFFRFARLNYCLSLIYDTLLWALKAENAEKKEALRDIEAVVAKVRLLGSTV